MTSDGIERLIEAGADLFLMPSRFEPCGLNQLYSMAYGTPPIVHRTGGLADTVREARTAPDAAVEGSGFVFDHARTDDLIAAVRRALDWWRHPERFRALQISAMSQEFGWDGSAEAYLDLYARILAQRWGEATS